MLFVHKLSQNLKNPLLGGLFNASPVYNIYIQKRLLVSILDSESGRSGFES